MKACKGRVDGYERVRGGESDGELRCCWALVVAECSSSLPSPL